VQNKKLKITFVLIAVLALVAVLFTVYFWTGPRKVHRQTNFTGQKQTIEAFIEKNIESIAPEEPVLGGKWFVTELKFLTPDTVRVHYEDGHVANVLDLKITNVKETQVNYRIME
jgi:sensor domain CHASE-containing protein